MTRKSIQDVELDFPRRITNKYQADALPPRVGVLDVNPNTGFRRPWIHGYTGERADLRIGKDNPALVRAREALADAGAPGDVIDALTLDELLVTPDLISGQIEGFNIRTSFRSPRQQPRDVAAGHYEPSGDIEILAVQNTQGWTDTHRAFVSRSFPSPCYVREFSATLSTTNNATYSTISITGVGLVLAVDPNTGLFSGTGAIRTINKLVEVGSVQLMLDIENQAPGTSMGDLFFATCVVERARLVR